MDEQIVRIIPFEEKHWEDCVRIAIQAWTGIHESDANRLGQDLHDDIMKDWQQPKLDEIGRKLRSGRGYVAVIDNSVVGFISYVVVDNKIGVIGGNAVDAAYRGRGIANVMYNHVLDKMKQDGAKIAKVSTGLDDGHAGARRAYEKVGFEKNLPKIEYYKYL